MAALGDRIAKLEQRLGSKGRAKLIALRTMGGATPDEIDNFLASQNIGYDPRRDQIVELRYFSGPLPQGIELLNVTER